MVPTAASPATPANRPAFAVRRSRFGSLTLTRLAFRRSAEIRPDDPAPRAGDDFVVDGVEHVGPVLCPRLAVDAGPEEDRLVTLADVARIGPEVDHELVHTDSADVGPQPAVDQ